MNVRTVVTLLFVCSVLFGGSAFASGGDVSAPTYLSTSGVESNGAPGWFDASYGRGGWLLGVFAPDVGLLNDKLSEHGFGVFDGTVPIFGGGGFGATEAWKFGGFGGGGRLHANVVGDRYATLSLGFGLAEVSRVWSTAHSRLQAGMLFGGGGATLRLSDGRPDTTDDAFKHRYDTQMDRGFFLVGPSVGVATDISRYVDFQLKAGYLFSLGGRWTHSASRTEIADLPNFAGPFVSIGLSFGGDRP